MKKLAFLVIFTPFVASAGLFRIPNLTFNGNPAPEIQAAVEAEVNEKLPSADTQEEYFSGMSDANAMSAAGVTTSYGTVFKSFLVGMTASGGAHLGSKSASDFKDLTKNPEQFRGFGAQASLIAGLNVGNVFGFDNSLFDPKKLKAYLSGFALDKKFGDVSAKYFGLGLGLQYRLFDETNWLGRSVKWTGVDIGTGLLYSSLDIDARINLNKTYNTSVNGQPVAATLTNSTALLNAEVSTISIPVEISTGLRIAYFLKFIAGLGVDFNFGETKGSGSMSSSSLVTGTVSGGGTIAGNPEFNVGGSEGPDFLNARLFVGPHIEFGVGSVFVNVHKSLFANSVAANAGVNFFW